MQGHGDPNSSLPYASSLCGACYDVCPVKIDIPSLLVELRGRAVDNDRDRTIPGGWDAAMKAAAWVMSDEKRFAAAEKGLGARPADGRPEEADPAPAAAAVRLDRQPGPAGPAGADLPRLVGATTTRSTGTRGADGGSRHEQPRHRADQDPGGAGRRRPAHTVPRGVPPAAVCARPGSEHVIELLVDRLVDYKALVDRVDRRGPARRRRCRAAGPGQRRRRARDSTGGSRPPAAAAAARWSPIPSPTALTPQELDAIDAVVTTARVAIAMSGTIILDGGPGQGRRAITLVPGPARHHPDRRADRRNRRRGDRGARRPPRR